jgi:hypothetical protein
MPISYQEQSQLTCPACGVEFAASLWLILDAQEQPEAVAALLRDELNLLVCPACGHSGSAGAPMLFHDGLARRVIFAPAPGSAEHEWREQARELHALLVGSLPEEQRRPYLGDVDIAQDLAGMAHRLRRTAKRYAARPSVSQVPPVPEQAGDTEPPDALAQSSPLPVERAAAAETTPPLLVAVEALLGADSPEELERTLAAHPILLDPASDAQLAQLAEVAVEQRAYEVAESLREVRALLGRVGAMARSAPAVSPAGEPPSAAPLTAHAPLAEEVIQALLHAQSAAELVTLVATYPELSHPAADQLLAERVELALDEGNDRLALSLEERREVLVQLRAASPADAASLDEAIEALLIAEGEAAIAAALAAYPILLEESAAQALWQFAAEARANDDEELARYATQCRAMLQRIRDGLAG